MFLKEILSRYFHLAFFSPLLLKKRPNLNLSINGQELLFHLSNDDEVKVFYLVSLT